MVGVGLVNQDIWSLVFEYWVVWGKRYFYGNIPIWNKVSHECNVLKNNSSMMYHCAGNEWIKSQYQLMNIGLWYLLSDCIDGIEQVGPRDCSNKARKSDQGFLWSDGLIVYLVINLI